MLGVPCPLFCLSTSLHLQPPTPSVQTGSWDQNFPPSLGLSLGRRHTEGSSGLAETGPIHSCSHFANEKTEALQGPACPEGVSLEFSLSLLFFVLVCFLLLF